MNRTLYQQLLDHAAQGYPDEVCGLIGGRDERATTLVPIPNISPTPGVRFEMDRRRMVEAIIGFQRAGLDVVAIYHSHPAGGSLPSGTDVAEMTWPDAAYLIVDLSKVGSPSVGAWTIRPGRVTPAALEIIPDLQ